MTGQDQRYEFLDGLRFLCALWVAVGHIGIPPFWSLLPDGVAAPAGGAVHAVGHVFCGTAAVIAFFVVSGFCIHLPYVRGRAFETGSFYIGRIPRVLIPLLAAGAIGALIPGGIAHLEMVLWSLYCEIGYYLLYPLLRWLFARYRLPRVLAPTYLIAAGVMAFYWDVPGGQLWRLGTLGSTLYGLPIWIAGCWIAEAVTQRRGPAIARDRRTAWLARVLVVASCAGLLLLHFNSPLHYVNSMLLFSIPCALWIYIEFNQRRGMGLYKRLGGLGQATFSIYLVHMLAVALVDLLAPVVHGLQASILMYLGVIAMSWVFYQVIEKPSHQLCRTLAHRRMERVAMA